MQIHLYILSLSVQILFGATVAIRYRCNLKHKILNTYCADF